MHITQPSQSQLPREVRPYKDLNLLVTQWTAYFDFAKMADDDLCIHDVIHQSFVKVDEKGTEAAAATAVVGNDTGIISEYFELKIDICLLPVMKFSIILVAQIYA